MSEPVSDDVVLAVLGAALLHASWNALWKARGEQDATATGLAASWAVMGWAAIAVVGVLPWGAAPMLVASVLVHVVYFEVLRRAYQAGDLSYVYPIARGTPPLMVAIVTWLWLGEPLSGLGVLGVVAIAVGSISLGPTGGTLRGRATVLALASAACTASYTVLDGIGTRASDPVTYLAWLIALQGTLYASGTLLRGGPELARRVWANRTTSLLAGIVSAAGYGVALWAMTRAPIAAVAALRETSVLFAASIGIFVLKEPSPRRRFVAAGVVAVGAGLLRLA